MVTALSPSVIWLRMAVNSSSVNFWPRMNFSPEGVSNVADFSSS